MQSPSLLKGISALFFVVWGLYSPELYAACTTTGAATGTGGDIVVCNASDTDGYTGTVNGDDITVPAGATVSNTGTNDTIVTNGGGDTITINGGSVTSGGKAIRAGSGSDTITINSGTVTADSHAIEGQGGNDTIIVNGGNITSTTGRAIRGLGGNDTITLNGGTITGVTTAINANAGDDIVTIGGNVVVNGIIDGGNGGSNNDALVFTMAVPESQLNALQTALLAKNPANDSITINGLTYTWSNFEGIQADLIAIAPVPSLTMWSLLMLILLLGFLGRRISSCPK